MEKLIIGGVCVYYFYVYGKKYLQEYVMGKVQEELNRRMKNEEEEELFKPNREKSAVIKIDHGGKKHCIYVPYDRKKSTRMIGKKVYLIKNGEKVDISQKPGVPYLVCAEDLGGENIQVEDAEGSVLKFFGKNEIPQI